MGIRTTLAAGAVLAICGFGVIRSLPSSKITKPAETPRSETAEVGASQRSCERTGATPAADVIDADQKLTYKDYEIEARARTATFDGYSKPVEVSYVTVRQKGKLITKFDADIYFPLGNSAQAGLFPLLGGNGRQLVVSQDISKTGVQWAADFSPRFKIIFDGQKFKVGREANDMTIVDLDSDGIQEITVPITSFYGFEKWRLTTSETPLPEIIFKYDPHKREYLPANPQFKECLLKEIEAYEARAKSRKLLGQVMSVVLDYIFVGEEHRGWKFFDENCTQPDKSTIQADIKKKLSEHPVYRYLQKDEDRRTAIRKIDFENFTYRSGPVYGKREFRLRGGRFDGYKARNDQSPWGAEPIGLVAVAYGDATGDGNEEAMVVLTRSVHGTAIPYYIYIFGWENSRPRLLWAISTGDRAQGGLRKVSAANGTLAIELYGGNARVNENVFGDEQAACCPASFTRTRYRWIRGRFVQSGDSEITAMNRQGASLEMEYRKRN